MGVGGIVAGMTPPPQAQPFLKYLPTLADWIRRDRMPTRGELSLLRMFAPDAFRSLQALTYEEILTLAAPYEADAELGPYVRLVKSDRGRAWVTKVLEVLRTM